LLDSQSLEARGFVGGGGGGGGEGFGGAGGGGGGEGRRKEAMGLKVVLGGGRWGVGEEAVGIERNCISRGMVVGVGVPFSNAKARSEMDGGG